MDGAAFDRITKLLAAGVNRRRVVRGVAGGALAGVVGLRAADETLARNICGGKQALCDVNSAEGFSCDSTDPDHHCQCAHVLRGGPTCALAFNVTQSTIPCSRTVKCPARSVCVDKSGPGCRETASYCYPVCQ